MTAQSYTPDTAPGFAKHSSSFKNDERCVEVHFIVGPSHDEVVTITRDLFNSVPRLVDYDVNYSLEGDAWVGVTCEDV